MLPIHHGLITGISNAGKPEAKAAVRQFITDVDEADGYLLPVCIRASDHTRFENGDNIESIVSLLPKYSKRSSHEGFHEI